MTTILRVDGISKSFDGLKALSNVSFDVEEGSIFGLMGANGAGKTTLFAIIAGQVTPSGGTVSFRNQILTGRRPDHICRMGICRTFQIVRPFAGITVLDNVVVSALYGASSVHSPRAASHSALPALQTVGLGDAVDPPLGPPLHSGPNLLANTRPLP